MGFTALFAKLLLLPASIIVCGRGLIAAGALFVIAKLSKKALSIVTKKEMAIVTIIGLLLSAHWATYFYLVQLSTIAIGLISLYTFPIITVILEPFFFKERLTRENLIKAILLFLGILIIIPEFSWSNTMTQGLVWGLISAVFCALRNLLNGIYIKKYSSINLMFWQTLIVGISLFPFLISYEGALTITVKGIIYFAILGIILSGITHTLFMESFTHLKVSTSSIIATLQPVYGIVWAALLLHEIPSWRTLIGGLFIVALVSSETLNQLSGVPAVKMNKKATVSRIIKRREFKKITSFFIL